jgi:hypothetical protein
MIQLHHYHDYHTMRNGMNQVSFRQEIAADVAGRQEGRGTRTQAGLSGQSRFQQVRPQSVAMLKRSHRKNRPRDLLAPNRYLLMSVSTKVPERFQPVARSELETRR